MGRRGRKRDYNGRTGDVIRFVQSHPRWTYLRIAGVFGVTRQAIAQLVVSEEKIRGVRLHIRPSRTPHLDSCRFCRKAVRILQKDSAWRTADLFPNLSRTRMDYHLAELRKARVFEGTISFQSAKMLKAYRAWRDGATALQIERQYGYSNWHSCLDKLAKPCPGVGRHDARDLRPNWQKDLEGHNIERLTKFILCGFGIIEETGRRVPFQQSVYARSKRLAIENAGVTLSRARGIKPMSVRVKRWEKGDGNRGG
jgi:hypothetical protein